MKRIVISLIAGGLGGIVIGFALGIFIYPYWFLNDTASEQLQSGLKQTSIAEGMFIHAQPNDPVHWGRGSVKLLRDENQKITVYLDMDFEVGPGPRFHVYLADKSIIRNNQEFEASTSFDLGRLRAFRGSQVYPVPKEVDISQYQSVVIWCKEFGALISPATLINRAEISSSLQNNNALKKS